jgi:Gametolysin peptidase M11
MTQSTYMFQRMLRNNTIVVAVVVLVTITLNATIHAAVVPIEEGHDIIHLHPKKSLNGLRHRVNLNNNVVTTTSERYLGLEFEDTYVQAPASSSSSSSDVDDEEANKHRSLSDSRTAIVFRINGPLGSPSASTDQLWGAIFTSGNSVKHQLARCSAGQLQLNPTNYGIRDIYINAYGNTNQGELAQMAEAAAIQSLGGGYSDIRQAADHIIFVMPNRGDNFVGSAEVCPNGVAGTSFFGDTYALSLSVVMHEMAHNLNLRHAGKNGDTYGDTSGMMGVSSGQTDGNPLQCYNACNHWTLGWFQSKRLDLSSGVGAPMTIQVATFVDADQAGSGQYVIVKLPGNLYMQYNRAKEFNIGTRDMIDKLAIVWDSSGSNQGDTSTVTGLDMSNPTYNSGSVVVQVCSIQIGGSVDYMVVSIGGGYADCNAGVSAAQANPQPQQQQQQQQQQAAPKASSSWSSWSSAKIDESETSSSSTTTGSSNSAWKGNNWK